MAVLKSSTVLAERIQQLLSERVHHAEAVVRIDETLERVGAALGASLGKRRGRKPGSFSAASGTTKVSRRRRRRSFETNAEEMVLTFVKGHRNPTTQDINRHWKSEGRGHTADNTLSKLTKEKKLKREPLKEGRGSRYTLA
jgi:hypothetical protein